MIRPVLALVLTAGAASAHPAMTAFDTTMRAAPSGHSRPVQQIPAHAQIDVGECGDRWCWASWRDMDGYIRAEAVAPNDAPLERPLAYYGGPVFVGPVFGYGFYRHRHW